MLELNPVAVRSMTRRLNSAASSVAQRKLSLSSCWLSVASAVTFLPARPASNSRALASRRKKDAAATSSMFKRLSNASKVSLLRVLSVRNNLKRKSLSVVICACVGRLSTASNTWRTGKLAASGASGTTPNAVTPVPSSKTARLPATRLGWRRRLSARVVRMRNGADRRKRNSQLGA